MLEVNALRRHTIQICAFVNPSVCRRIYALNDLQRVGLVVR